MNFTAENAKGAEKQENRISGIILGHGLLESAYRACLTYE